MPAMWGIKKIVLFALLIIASSSCSALVGGGVGRRGWMHTKTAAASFSVVSSPLPAVAAATTTATATALRATPATDAVDTDTSIENDLETLIAAAKQRAVHEHEAQFKDGATIFGSSSDDDAETVASTARQQFTDDDFRSYDIGATNYGPVSHPSVFDHKGQFVFETLEPVLTEDDCSTLIAAARQTISEGKMREASDDNSGVLTSQQQQRSGARTNSDLGEARLSALPPDAIQLLRKILQVKLYPLLASRFGDHNDMTLYDGLILGSIAPSMSQPIHRDASLLTLNIPLSAPDSFTGGGTYIEPLEDGFAAPLRIERGQALCHASGIMHAGTGIQTGERWVLVMFLLAKDEPQIARRCHAEGLGAIQRGELDQAKVAFCAGLSESSSSSSHNSNNNNDDHLLHMGLGSIANIKGDEKTSFRCLAKAAQSYPLGRKAPMAMGNMLLAQKRPRAALRQFERLLADIQDRDLETEWMPLKAFTWELRIAAARSCMMCAEWEASKFDTKDRQWAKARMPQVIDWLKLALVPAPNDDRIHGLLERAQELLADAETS